MRTFGFKYIRINPNMIKKIDDIKTLKMNYVYWSIYFSSFVFFSFPAPSMILLLPQIWLCISQRVTFRNPAQYLIYVPHSWKAMFNIEKLKYHFSAFNWAKYFRSFASNLAEFRILKLLQENIIICLKHFEYFQIIPNNQCFCDIKTFLPIEAKPNFLPWKEDVIIFDSNFTNSLFFTQVSKSPNIKLLASKFPIEG